MKSLCRVGVTTLMTLVTVVGSALGCGTPPQPPPPPPAPPVVCCRIVSWFIDPICQDREIFIICYFREDGLPMFVSNPMDVTPGQQCGCGLGSLPPIPGVADGGIAFGPPGQPGDSCILFPSNQPGYGPFTPECNPQTANQIDSFFDIFYNLAKIPAPSTGPCPNVSTTQQFRGPGFIPPNVTFGVYRKVVAPRGFDPNNLCGTGLTAIGLFLVENGQVFIEPEAPGLPPVTFQQFQQRQGRGAMYKVKCLPFDLPGPCPLGAEPCPGDLNNNGVIDFGDIGFLLASFGSPCP